ncbi:MAG: DUF2953 domain-containing protein [Acetobacteraceae bacterium]|nr:DUF2953 domain-containing protein [Acetobacteraceae bacterium]
MESFLSWLAWIGVALSGLAFLAALVWLSPVDLEADFRGGLGGQRFRVRFRMLWGLVRVGALDLVLGRPAPSGLARRLPYRLRTPARLHAAPPRELLLDWVAGLLPSRLRRWLNWGRTTHRWLEWARRQRRRRRARGLWEAPAERLAALGFFGWAQVYTRLFQRILGRAAFRRFSWHTVVGTGDPAETGWAVGSLWAIKAAVGAWAARTLPGRARPRLNVVPDFYRRRLRTRLYCIARLRAGDIIYATVRARREFEARRAAWVREAQGALRELRRAKGARAGA